VQRIFISEIEGKKALCFDTGLDSRSFAQSRFFQCIAVPGFIVSPSGSIETWKASGVAEGDASMLVWGPPFSGGRLDVLVNNGKDEAISAIAWWIRARLALGENQAAFDSPVALIAGFGTEEPTHSEGTVFFPPLALSRRCLLAEGAEPDRYNCPDLEGMEAAVFSAAAMLYRVFAGCAPFSAADENLYQDMREGNFVPLRYAAPGIDEKLGNLVQAALVPSGGAKKPGETADGILRQFLEILMPAGREAKTAASFFRTLSGEEEALLKKEKERLLKRNKTVVNTRRFITRNKAVLLGIAAAVVIVFFAANSVLKSRAELPTTRGMDSGTVVHSYYNAIGELDHPLIEACLAKEADKSDLDMVINLFVISRVRQAYENNPGPGESGAFGITDLTVTLVSGGEEDGEARYLAVYTLCMPEGEDYRPIRRRDELTLARRRGNWQITEIKRTVE